jgi:hypothetical protein
LTAMLTAAHGLNPDTFMTAIFAGAIDVLALGKS